MFVRLFSASVFASILLLTQLARAAAPPCASVDSCDEAGTSFEQQLKQLEEWDEQLRKANAAPLERIHPPEKEKLLERRLRVPCSVRFDRTPLESVIEDDAVQITTKEQASRKSVTATYCVADLLRSIRSIPAWQRTLPKLPHCIEEEELIQLIQGAIQPGSWSSGGGRGTIDYIPVTGALVIHQTPDVQEEVAELLSALRRLYERNDSAPGQVKDEKTSDCRPTGTTTFIRKWQ
jgi:hypothetical protein